MTSSMRSRFIGGTISVGLGNLSTMLLGLLSMAVVARHLPAEAFGTFVLLQVVATFLTRVSGFGLGLSVPKFVSSSEDQRYRRQLINTVIYFRLLTIPVVSGIALLARPALSTLFGAPQFVNLVVFVLLLFLLDSMGQLLKSVLQGLFLFKMIAITDLVASFLNFILIVVFVLFFDQGLLGLVYAKVISMTAAYIFAYVSVPVEKKLEFHPDVLRQALRFGFPLQVNDILTFVFLRIDTVLIGALLGPADIAYYEIARKIPESLGGLYEAFRAVFFPFVSRLFALGEQKKAAQMLNHSTRLISFVTVLGALIALVFGDQVMILLFSEKYLPSVPTFMLLMLGLSLTFIDYTLGYSLVAVGDSDKPALINVVHTAVSLLGNLTLIPLLGIIGAALASLAGFAATNPLNVLFLRRRGIGVRVQAYLKPILIFGVYWLLILLLRPTIFLQKALIITLFLVTCVFLSVVTVEDLTTISQEARVAVDKALLSIRSRSTRT